jgi:hypothetical protein
LAEKIKVWGVNIDLCLAAVLRTFHYFELLDGIQEHAIAAAVAKLVMIFAKLSKESLGHDSKANIA